MWLTGSLGLLLPASQVVGGCTADRASDTYSGPVSGKGSQEMPETQCRSGGLTEALPHLCNLATATEEIPFFCPLSGLCPCNYVYMDHTALLGTYVGTSTFLTGVIFLY